MTCRSSFIPTATAGFRTTGYDDLVARHYRGGHMGFEPLARGGAPQSGRYTIRIQAAAIDRTHSYDFLKDFRNGDPIVMELAAVNREGSVESTGNITTQRTLALVELTSDKPQWFEWTVDLERGEEPEIRFRNGAAKAKALAVQVAQKRQGTSRTRSSWRRWKEGKAPVRRRCSRPIAVRSSAFGKCRLQVRNSTSGRRVVTPCFMAISRRIRSTAPTSPNGCTFLPKPPSAVLCVKASWSPIGKLVTAKLDAGMKPLEALQLGFQTILCSPAFLHLHEGHRQAGRLRAGIATVLFLLVVDAGPDADPARRRRQTARARDARRAGGSHARRSEVAALRAELHPSLAEPRPHRRDARFHRTSSASYRDNIDAAMRAETEMFFRHILDKNLPTREFLGANYTFLNRELALHYGLPPMEGVQLRQMSLPKGERGGLLTQASFLTASANGVDTSPVVRGVYVQEKILGYTPPPPPPDVPLIEPDASGATTIREQLADASRKRHLCVVPSKDRPFRFRIGELRRHRRLARRTTRAITRSIPAANCRLARSSPASPISAACSSRVTSSSPARLPRNSDLRPGPRTGVRRPRRDRRYPERPVGQQGRIQGSRPRRGAQRVLREELNEKETGGRRQETDNRAESRLMSSPPCGSLYSPC